MKPVIIIAIAFVLLIPVSAFAQSGSTHIKIDKHAYEIGDQIIFSGDVGTIVEGRTLYIFLNDPDGKWLSWTPFIAPGHFDPSVDRYINEDGSFSGVYSLDENYFDRCGSFKLSLVYTSIKNLDFDWDSPPTLDESLFTFAGMCEPKCRSGEILENGVCVISKQTTPIQPTSMPEPTCSSGYELVNGICTKIQTSSSSQFSTSNLGGSSSSTNQNQNFGLKTTVKSLTYHEQYGEYIDGVGEFSIKFDYDLDFRIEHPEKIEAGKTVDFTITPMSGILTSVLTVAGESFPPDEKYVGLGDSDGLSYAVVKVDVQPTLNINPYGNGPVSISSSNISMNSMNSKTIRLTADNNIGNSNSITMNLPATLYLNAALKFTLFNIPFLPELTIEELPLAKKMTPQISIKIPLIKYHKTKLTLDVEKSSKDQYVKIKPNLKLVSGQSLSKSVSIEVNGIHKKSLQANQWSNDFYLGYGQHNIQAIFKEITDNSNNAIIYQGSSSSIVKTTLTEPPKSETSAKTSTQSNSPSTKSGLTCGSGTHEENGQCVADSMFGGGCLIATATYGSELAHEVQKLRELRDNTLLTTTSGTQFMNTFNDFYYSFSPYIADYERENPIFKEMVKIVITPMISSLSILNYVDMDSESSVLGYGISLILLNGLMYVGIPASVIVVVRRF